MLHKKSDIIIFVTITFSVCLDTSWARAGTLLTDTGKVNPNFTPKVGTTQSVDSVESLIDEIFAEPNGKTDAAKNGSTSTGAPPAGPVNLNLPSKVNKTQDADSLTSLIEGIFAEQNGNMDAAKNSTSTSSTYAPPTGPVNLNLPSKVNKTQDADSLTSLIEEIFAEHNEKMDAGRNSTSTSSTYAPPTGPVNLDSPPNGNRTQISGGGGGGIGGTSSCTCIPYYLCKNDGNTNEEGTIDIANMESPCQHYLDVCCDPANRIEKSTPPPRRECGHRNPNGVGYEISQYDDESQFAEFPWMVAVLRDETGEGTAPKLNVYQCGGALIHPQVVLTAAHCVASKDKKFRIRAGEWDTQRENKLYPYQERDVEKVVLHPQYYAKTLHNDVALLFLKSPVTIGANVDVVCLPAQGQVIDDARCFVTGWGKDVFGKEGSYRVILKKTELPILERMICQDALRSTRLGHSFKLHTSFICAGGGRNKQTCKGDGGSPLVCPISGQSNRYVQAGILAWGVSCDGSTPSVYVNVASFREWIDEQMTYNNLDPRSYD